MQSASPFIRTSAWVLLQALVFSSILPPVPAPAQPDTLRAIASDEAAKTRAGMEEALKRVVTLEQVRSASSWGDLFGNGRPVAWEIGEREGVALFYRAEENLGINFLGIDLYRDPPLGFFPYPFPPNVKFLPGTDVRDLLKALPENLLAVHRIYLDFPPTVAGSFIREVSLLDGFFSALVPGGEMVVRTESEEIVKLLEQAAGRAPPGSSMDVKRAVRHEGVPDSDAAQQLEELGIPVYLVTFKRSPIPGAPAGAEELQVAVPLDQVPVYPAGTQPDFSSAPFVFVSLVAGEATRWQTSIKDAGLQAKFAARTDTATGQVTEILSKVLVPLSGVPGFSAETDLPAGWLPVAGALSLGGWAIAVIGHQKDLVMQRFGQLDAQGRVSYVEQTNRDGSGGAVWRALAAGNLGQFPDKPVVIAAGDQPLLDATVFRSILDALAGTDLVVGTSVVENPKDKGRIVHDRRSGAVLAIKEQKDIDKAIREGQEFPDAYRNAGYSGWQDLDSETTVNTGVYGVKVGLMSAILSGITNDNAQTQFYATDMVTEALKQGKTVTAMDIPAWKMPDVTRIGDLDVVRQTFFDRASELKYTAGAEEGIDYLIRVIRPLDEAAVQASAVKLWNMSFSGVRAVTIPEMRDDKGQFNRPFPVDAREPVNLQNGDWIMFAKAGYEYAKFQLAKLLKERDGQKKFTFVLARDAKATGRDGLAAQAAGMQLAADELGLELRFKMAEDSGILPTPMAASLVRMLNADGGVIVTASHNPPDENGFKYLTAAKEPKGAPVEGGTVLAAKEMTKIVRVLERWKKGGKAAAWNKFLKKLTPLENLTQTTTLVGTIPGDRIIDYVVGEQRKMLGLENDSTFAVLPYKTSKIKLLIDPNGGAAARFYAEVARYFGFDVVEINGELGLFDHQIEPVGEGMARAREEMIRHGALLALVTDGDADRGNTLLLRRLPDGRVEAVELPPWDVAMLNLSIALGMSDQREPRKRDGNGNLAVVLHDFPDARLRALAQRYGVEVYNAETGEVNVLMLMRKLQKEWKKVVMGAEQANGGTILPGLDPLFFGDTSRSGISTLLIQAMALAQPEIVSEWFNGIVPEGFDLAMLWSLLPGEHAPDDAPLEWHVATIMRDKLGRDRVPPEAAVPFKKKVLEWMAQAIQSGDGVFAGKVASAEATLYSETESIPPVVLRNGEFKVRAGTWKKFGTGGMRVTVRYENGRELTLWMRGSRTEGGMRSALEVWKTKEKNQQIAELNRQFGAAADQIAPVLQPGETPWWTEAGTEETMTTSIEAENSLIILTPETAWLGIEALKALRTPAGEKVHLAVIVKNAQEAVDVNSALASAGWAPLFPIVNLDEQKWNLEQAVSHLQIRSLQEKSLNPVPIRTLQDLAGLGNLLLPGTALEAWAARMESLLPLDIST